MTSDVTSKPRATKNKPKVTATVTLTATQVPCLPKSTKRVAKKRKKRGHYHTGIHLSPKCKEPIAYRSGWELSACKHLDSLNTVDEYWYESVRIPYVANVRSSKTRYYLPDFIIKFSDGSMKMVEVKRENQLTNLKVMKKAAAAKLWCQAQKIKITYEFWTDKIILPLQKKEKEELKLQEQESFDDLKKKVIAKRTKSKRRSRPSKK